MKIIEYNDNCLEDVKELLVELEEYFKNVGCEYIFVDVFAYNEIAKNFYSKNDYHTRGEIRIKKID